MANTYTKIANYTAAGSVASIDFSSIPATYTDLLLKVSARNSTNGPAGIFVAFNGSTTTFTNKYLEGNGSTVASGSLSRYVSSEDASTYTASTFSNNEIYIPNYLGSNNKTYSADGVVENNATTTYATLTAGLWSTTSAINQITLTLSAGNFVIYSTATLYGIKNS